jgi:hypothetical protein
MRLRAGKHGFSAVARAFTVAVIVTASLAQLASLSHEMTVRHFRCAEHGELTHVAAMPLNALAAPARTGGAALRAEANATADGHEHCSGAFTIEGRASTALPAVTGEVASPPPAAAPVAPRLERGRAVALAAAPKTSPPRA